MSTDEKLLLDANGRYIQGPDFGKVEMLEDHGAKRRTRRPSKFPLGPGRQMIAVVFNECFEAALWVQDDSDFLRIINTTVRRVVWLDMKNEKLFEANRRVRESKPDPGAVNGIGRDYSVPLV